MSPFVQTLLRSLQVPELELEPEPELEPELVLELVPEPADAGGLEAGELAGGELPTAGDALVAGLAGAELAGADCGLDEAWSPPHLPPAQMLAQSRFLNVPAGYRLGSLKSVRFWWSTSARSRLCLCNCWWVG